MLFFLTLIIAIYKVKNMPAIPSFFASLFYGLSLLLSTLPIGKYTLTLLLLLPKGRKKKNRNVPYVLLFVSHGSC